MKTTSVLVFAVALSLLMVSQAAGDPGMGAVVIKEDGNLLFWDGFWDGTDTLELESNGENGLEVLLCGDDPVGEPLPYQDLIVIRPDGSVKFLEKGSVYSRVYTPVDLEDFNADPCAFLGFHLPVAAGIVTYRWTDNDFDVNHGGRPVWGFNYEGSLYDLTGLCPAGMMHLQIVRRWQIDPKDADWPDCFPDCFVTKVAKGPRLSCKKF